MQFVLLTLACCTCVLLLLLVQLTPTGTFCDKRELYVRIF